MIHGLAAVDGGVVLVADCQGPEPPLYARIAGFEQGLAAVEISLVQVHAETHAGFEWVVQQGEVRPVVAIPLFHAERIQRPVAAGPDAERTPRRHQPVPHLARPGRVDVQLPAQLTHVRDPLRESSGTGDRQVLRLHERKRAFRYVIGRHRAEDLASSRPPQADHGELLCGLAHVDKGVAVAELQAQPAEIAVDIPRAGDKAKAIGIEPGDRDVGCHSAVLLEQLRVDDGSCRLVEQIAGDPLEKRQRSRAADLDLAERAHVDDADALAKRGVLFGDRGEIWRALPTETALVSAGPATRRPRLQVLRSLPAMLRAEHSAEVLHAGVERARPARATPFVRVIWIAQVVVVLVRLAGELRRVSMVAVHGSEPPGAIGEQVELGLARRDQLGKRAADAAGAAESVEGKPRRQVEPRHARHRTDQRGRIRRHRVGVADELDDSRLAEEREPPRSPGQEPLEACLVRWERGPGVRPRHAVDPPCHGVGLVSAEHDASRFGLAVHEIVGIAEAGHVVRQLMARDGEERRVLVVYRSGDDKGPGHCRHLRRPYAAGDDDGLGLERLRVCSHGLDRTSVRELDASDPLLREDARTELVRCAGQRVGRGVRVEMAVVRHPDGSVELACRDGRHQARGFLRRNELDVEPDSASPAHSSAQLHQLFVARGETEASNGLEDAKLAVQLDAVAAKSHHRRRRVELRDQAGRVAGRSAGQLILLQQDGLAPARLREVVRDAGPGDPAPDDDRARSLHRP